MPFFWSLNTHLSKVLKTRYLPLKGAKSSGVTRSALISLTYEYTCVRGLSIILYIYDNNIYKRRAKKHCCSHPPTPTGPQRGESFQNTTNPIDSKPVCTFRPPRVYRSTITVSIEVPTKYASQGIRQHFTKSLCFQQLSSLNLHF